MIYREGYIHRNLAVSLVLALGNVKCGSSDKIVPASMFGLLISKDNVGIPFRFGRLMLEILDVQCDNISCGCEGSAIFLSHRISLRPAVCSAILAPCAGLLPSPPALLPLLLLRLRRTFKHFHYLLASNINHALTNFDHYQSTPLTTTGYVLAVIIDRSLP